LKSQIYGELQTANAKADIIRERYIPAEIAANYKTCE